MTIYLYYRLTDASKTTISYHNGQILSLLIFLSFYCWLMFSYFLSQKAYQYLALLIFSSVMASVVLIFLPYFNLIGPVNHNIALLANFFSASASGHFLVIPICLLCAIPVLMKLPAKIILRLWIQFFILLVLGMIATTALKHITHKPRPYTYELQQLHIIPTPQAFYALNDDNKAIVLDAASIFVSLTRLTHWADKTDYSMPSGHTVFAAICVLFWGGFLLRHKKYIPSLLLIGWATGVGASRIWLGLHWPTDLLMSIACAGVLYLFIPEACPRNNKQRT